MMQKGIVVLDSKYRGLLMYYYNNTFLYSTRASILSEAISPSVYP